MNQPPDLLHNLHDHIGMLLKILEDENSVQGETRARLLRHLSVEERANQELISQAIAAAPANAKQPLEIALDHSHFVQAIIEGKEIRDDLGISLLKHMLEEHQQGLHVSPPRRPETPGLTVGSLNERNEPR